MLKSMLIKPELINIAKVGHPEQLPLPASVTEYRIE